jgi:hypothetical protein
MNLAAAIEWIPPLLLHLRWLSVVQTLSTMEYHTVRAKPRGACTAGVARDQSIRTWA